MAIIAIDLAVIKMINSILITLNHLFNSLILLDAVCHCKERYGLRGGTHTVSG